MKRQRDRAEASIGSDQTSSSAQRQSSILPRASLRAQDRSRGAPAQTQAQANKTLQTQDQPPKSKHPKAKPATLHGTQRQRDRAEASIGSDQTSSSAQRQSSILPQASLRAQDRSRGTPAQTRAQAPKTLQTQDQPPKSKHPKAKPCDTPWHQAAAGSGWSKHRNVDTLLPIARQRESPAGPNVPCERRTDPAEPHRQRALGASPSTPPPQNR